MNKMQADEFDWAVDIRPTGYSVDRRVGDERIADWSGVMVEGSHDPVAFAI